MQMGAFINWKKKITHLKKLKELLLLVHRRTFQVASLICILVLILFSVMTLFFFLTSNSHSWLRCGVKVKNNSSSALQENLFESLCVSPAPLRRENITSQPRLSWRAVSLRIHSAGLWDRWWVIFTHSHVCAARNKRQRRTVTPSTDAKPTSCYERFGVTDCSMDCSREFTGAERHLVRRFFLTTRWKRMNFHFVEFLCVFVFEFYHCWQRRQPSCRPPTASDWS